MLRDQVGKRQGPQYEDSLSLIRLRSYVHGAAIEMETL